ncbi:uncharacterized protein LOC110685852 [Chenopodium quinoa]|uniref:uncharacterized protein LOC110685852 n=1 Tax=Chenopodium quinoa TaxID=63459 RepID=UPI000B7704A9|nr:uncharacterized protein LOC110685852 [Chenopodium quinoa]
MIWNTQGTGSREFINVLKEIVRVNKPCVLALVETHMGGDHAQKIASILNYNGHTRVDAQGYSGGIWIYWKPELVKVDPITKHNQYITMMITRVGEIPWYFTAIYASPDPSKRSELWYEFRKFADNNNQPWLLAGDFNETRYSWERNSSCPETSRRSERFNAWVDDTQLLELEFSGPSHTWLGEIHMIHIKVQGLTGLCVNSEWGLRKRSCFGTRKARVDWLADGDRNTTFFHLSTVVKRWRNKIVAVKDENNQWIHDKEEVKNLIVNYFRNLFTDDGVHGEYNIPTGMCSPFSSSDLDKLSRPYSKCDIDYVIQNMGSLKAPGRMDSKLYFIRKIGN